MYKIPRVIPPCDDEMLASWVARLASENGFDNPWPFLNAYIYPNEAISVYSKRKFDFRIPFEYFWRALPHNGIDERSLFLQTSTFSCSAPFFTPEQRQRYINQAFNTNSALEPLFPSPHGTLESLYICPECAKSEIASKGFFILHRAHHLPGVKVCHIHGCALGRVKDRYMRLSINRIPAYEEESVSKEEWAIRYARFAKAFLDAGIDCSIADIAPLIRERLTDTTVNEIESESIDYLTKADLQKLCKGDLKYLSHKCVLAAVHYLFKDVDTFRASLPQDESTIIQFPFGEYELVGEYRRDLIMVRHRLCGSVSCTSPYGFKVGWRCVNCDKGKPLQEKYQELIAAVSDYAYEAVSEFESMDGEVQLHHFKCDRTSTFKARAFLYEGVRCECQRRVFFEDAKRAVEQYEGFSLVSFERTDRHMTVSHSCGGKFEILYSKFFEKPFCRVCERKGHLKVRTTEDFKNDMKDLVGREYSLIGDYNGPHAYLTIKHNVCGNTQKYRPFYFLDGGRCKYCHKETTEEEFRSYVYQYSKGKYTVSKKATKNLYEVIDNTDGRKIRLSKLRILQELHRPTPSPVLPLNEKNENILLREDRTSEKILEWIYNRYEEEPIFIEDVQIKDVSLEEKQYTLANLEKAGKLVRIAKGVYGLPEREYTKESVIKAKYLLRRNRHIGFYRGKYFAYKLGLSNIQPELSIASNKESAKTTARKISFLGVPIHIKGVPIEIDSENYLVLEAIDFLVQYRQCTEKPEEEVLDAIRNYITEANNGLMLPYSSFEPYIEQYRTANIKTIMRRIIAALCEKQVVE